MSDGLIRTLFGIPVVLLVMFSLAALLSLALHRLSAWAGDWPTFALRLAGRAAGGEEWLFPDRVDVKLSPQSSRLILVLSWWSSRSARKAWAACPSGWQART